MAQIGEPTRVHELEPVMEPWEMPREVPEGEPVTVPDREEVPA